MIGRRIGLILAVGACALFGGRAFAPPAGSMWLTDYESAKAVAKKSGKPMLVIFRCAR